MKQHQKMITLEQNLIIWLNKKNATLNYVKRNNYMSCEMKASLIHDIINVVFQSKKCKIIVRSYTKKIRTYYKNNLNYWEVHNL